MKFRDSFSFDKGRVSNVELQRGAKQPACVDLKQRSNFCHTFQGLASLPHDQDKIFQKKLMINAEEFFIH